MTRNLCSCEMSKNMLALGAKCQICTTSYALGAVDRTC
jgi:hypothetical protein